MILKSIVVGPLEVNCYVLACEETREGIVIDPGDNVPGILEMIEEDEIEINEIVATHGHFDHIGRVTTMKEALQVPFAIHEDDMFMVEGLVEIASFLDIDTDEAPKVDRFIQIGEEITFGNETLSVIHTPGHAPGNVTLLWPSNALVGDVLFAGSIGRTDIEGADPDLLMQSIQRELLTLPDKTNVYPGHGPFTTIGQERSTNPFLQ
ncbi:MAG: MBL fold metallo-hydrolase [Candidatus Latescibacterota bacterium]|nr:MBL fold metallo-hydrolase [Candidatus Latescibacterota bacterium]